MWTKGLKQRRVEVDSHNEAEHAKRYPSRPLLSQATHLDWENAVGGDAGADRYRKPRKLAIGTYAGRLHVVVYAHLGSEAYSKISFRRASKKERMAYDEAKAS
jgi:uncharacterized DUF497 family protein